MALPHMERLKLFDAAYDICITLGDDYANKADELAQAGGRQEGDGRASRGGRGGCAARARQGERAVLAHPRLLGSDGGAYSVGRHVAAGAGAAWQPDRVVGRLPHQNQPAKVGVDGCETTGQMSSTAYMSEDTLEGVCMDGQTKEEKIRRARRNVLQRLLVFF